MVINSRTSVGERSPRPVRTNSLGQVISEETSRENTEFLRLKCLLPQLSSERKISKLEIVLEAIVYIDQLQEQLLDKILGTDATAAASADIDRSYDRC